MPWPIPVLDEVNVFEFGWLVKGVANTERLFYNCKLWLGLWRTLWEYLSNSCTTETKIRTFSEAKFILTHVTCVPSWSISIQNSRNPFQDQTELFWEFNYLFPLQDHSYILLWKLWLFPSFPNYSENLIRQHDKHIISFNIKILNLNILTHA